MKTAMILSAAGALLAAGLVVGGVKTHEMHAQAGHGHGEGGPMLIPHIVGWLADQAVTDLDVTDAQRTRVLAVKERVLSQAMALREQHDTTHEAFKREWDGQKMDAGKLHALVDARVEEMRRVLHTAVDGVVEVHDTLTVEQRQKLTEKIEAMHGSE